jgi:hypothetical protein
MELTKDELYELEKMCDIAADQTARGMADMLQKLSVAGFQHHQTQKWFDEYTHAYDKLRTISAKLEAIRNG